MMIESDETIAPQRLVELPQGDDATMPGSRDRIMTGRFAVGDPVMHRYKVLAELGQGGMGVVYKCFDEVAGIEVALKALPPELSHNTLEMEDIRENFRLVHNLHHPNIASSNTLERDDSNGNYYLIMECCGGEDLRHWLRRKHKEGTLTPELIFPIIRQIADALDYAHGQKIIHRDIKPGNIMIAPDGKIKVLDFGLAAQIHTSMSRVSMAHHSTGGTGPYMAPEQWEGRIQNAAADQYALAAMTYEMFSGHPPFEGSDTAVLREAVLKSKVPPLGNIPKYIEKAIMRALSKNPQERFDCCCDFAAALEGRKVSCGKRFCSFFVKWAAVLIASAVVGCAVYYIREEFHREQTLPKLPEKEKTISKQTVGVTSGQAERDRQQKLAAEQERLKRAAERDAELKRKEKQIEERKKNDELKRFVSRLQNRVKLKKEKIDSADCDRGQTFGGYLDRLNNDFSAAGDALSKNDPATARKFYETAEKAADWLLANASRRKEVRSLQKLVAEKKSQAEKSEALKYFPAEFRNAEALAAAAVKYYEAGCFESAAAELKSALDEFEKARSASRSSKITELLNEATIARNSKLWRQMLEYSKAVLQIDEKNENARKMKQEAEDKLTPTLEIIAVFNGKRVPAAVRFGNRAADTMKVINGLTGGKHYRGILTWQDNDEVYLGSIEFVCDWSGPKQMTAVLKEQESIRILLGEGTILEMIRIPHGSFVREDQKTVTLTRDYWMSKFEVTQAQWRAVMGNNPSRFSGDFRPVENVNWEEAKQLCARLNALHGSRLPDGCKFDLPTEAQWEYACRAGSGTNFSYGNASNAAKMNFNGSFPCGGGAREVFRKKTVDVGSLGYKNAFGLYDMHGNVWEWCRDWYSSYGGSTTDPAGAASGFQRVFRGGSWCYNARYCSSAYRNSYAPADRAEDLGIRLVLTAER